MKSMHDVHPAGIVSDPARWEVRSEKIQPSHRERLAVVYVRQSSLQQVANHQESTRLQYGLTSRAHQLGWDEHRIVVIDDDQGKSASTTEGRLGFQHLVSEVSLDHVGIILGIEMSRLARSNRDWHQLLEICALFQTLLADLDGIYDPAQYNDRLLLGLKGTMSEAELHILKQRLNQGRLNKARRGELVVPLPTGYVRRASGEVLFDPDEQVQHVIRLIFRKFEELQTVNAVLRYLVDNDIRLGIRVREKLGKGELEWRRPNRVTVQYILKHPIYGGAFAYGRRQVDPRRQRPGQAASGRITSKPQEWLVLLKDQYPAYISWEQYECNQARLASNRARAESLGVARSGPALLAGLVVCGRCGRRMRVLYHGDEGRAVYMCSNGRTTYGEEICQIVSGCVLDPFVSERVLAALEPAALELSLEAAQHVEQERQDLVRLWQQRLERASYEAERAGRQYRLVEPENRLVARQLEREWEEKLSFRQKLEEDYHRFLATGSRVLSEEEREAIRHLAADIPALWEATTTTIAERKEIIRQVVERVVVDALGDSEQVRVGIEWAGGSRTEEVLTRSVRSWEQVSYYPQLCARLRALAEAGLSAKVIAQRLNAEGYRPPKRSGRLGEPAEIGQQAVKGLLYRLGLRQRGSGPRSREGLGADEWWLSDLAREIGMGIRGLDRWIRKGQVRARQQGVHGPWIVSADEQEVERLRQRCQCDRGDIAHQRWVVETDSQRGERGASLPR